MKKVQIKIGYIGLVYRNEKVVRVLEAGRYFISLFEELRLYDLRVPFVPQEGLDLALKNAVLANYVQLVDVADGEIVYRYENDRFAEPMLSGSYAYFKGLVNYRFVRDVFTNNRVSPDISENTLRHPAMTTLVQIIRIDTFTNAVQVLENGEIRVLTPGDYYFYNNKKPLTIKSADMRVRMMEISGQELLTRDKASLRISMFASLQVNDVVKALAENTDYEKQLYTLLQLALRAFTGTKNLDEILENKESISAFVMAELREEALKMGVNLISCGVRDIILPGEMREIFNRVLVAEKQAQANIILRREESASTRNLLNTAKLMEENEVLYRLKEMEYVERIAEKIGSLSVSGNGQLLNQLKEIFTPAKKGS